MRMKPNAPIYIVSKSRSQLQWTSRELHAMDVRHYVVVEEQQHADYAAHANRSATLLVLDKQYQRDYDTCDDLGDTKSKGPGAARNFAWAHALADGAQWHWVMDDNIRKFVRLYHNMKVPCYSGAIFRAMEDFAARYENVVMAGPNYFMFAPRKVILPPIALNTRIYSCNLIRNDIPFRWRGRYNEDTDISLRILKAGLCTVQFYAFLQDKATTQTVKGGNHDDFYAKEGTRAKSEMQVKLHPDVSRVVFKFNRVHHYVDYSPFKANKLKRKAGLVVQEGIDTYRMKFDSRVNDETHENYLDRTSASAHG